MTATSSCTIWAVPHITMILYNELASTEVCFIDPSHHVDIQLVPTRPSAFFDPPKIISRPAV
jgi:hypothetical protein